MGRITGYNLWADLSSRLTSRVEPIRQVAVPVGLLRYLERERGGANVEGSVGKKK